MAGRAAAAAPKVNPPTLPSHRIERFFRRHLIHGKGQFAGEPFVLEAWQADEIRAIFDPLEVVEGRYMVRRIREALIGVSKKNGKTHLAAGLGAYGLFADGYWVRDGRSWIWRPEYGAEVYNVAGSKPQAGVLFEIASGFVERSPFLRSMARTFRDAIEFPEHEAVWRVLPADGKLAHGPNPSIAIIDEIWTHRKPDLYEAFASAGAARRQPLLLTITTAGFERQAIAHRLYLRGKDARRSERIFYFSWREAPEGCELDDRKAWKLANPSRWVTAKYLEGELRRARRLGLESEFRRFHLNQWATASEVAIPVGLWDANNGRPRIPDGAEVVVAVDAAPKRDSTAIAIDHRDRAGIHNVRATILWADPDTGYLDFGAVEDLLRELCRRYNVRSILVDPYNMTRSMVMLQEEGLPIDEAPQTDARMVPCSMNLYELLIDGRLRHGGDHELRAQVLAAGKKETSRGWRIHKLKSSGQIDGLIAVAIAAHALEVGFDEEDDLEPQLFV